MKPTEIKTMFQPKSKAKIGGSIICSKFSAPSAPMLASIASSSSIFNFFPYLLTIISFHFSLLLLSLHLFGSLFPLTWIRILPLYWSPTFSLVPWLPHTAIKIIFQKPKSDYNPLFLPFGSSLRFRPCKFLLLYPCTILYSHHIEPPSASPYSLSPPGLCRCCSLCLKGSPSLSHFLPTTSPHVLLCALHLGIHWSFKYCLHFPLDMSSLIFLNSPLLVSQLHLTLL